MARTISADDVVHTAGSDGDQRGLLDALVGDGRPLLLFVGLALVLSGAFALFLSARGEFLPHDERYLGMQAAALCSLQQCRIVHFMIHDRTAFGGSLVAVGSLYMWLAEFPLRARQSWAWWTFVVSGAAGFGSFLAYLGYGYLDSWHGVGTLLLLPVFVAGLLRSRSTLPNREGPAVLLRCAEWGPWRSIVGAGRLCLLTAAFGMIVGGLTIMAVGMTSVFVPQDLAYIGLDAGHIRAINPRLVPLIAHDRAGFGGGIATCGLTLLSILWCARPSRSLWQVLCWSGAVGFTAAIGVHALIGYTNPVHLAPAVAGAALFAVGLAFCTGQMLRQGRAAVAPNLTAPPT